MIQEIPQFIENLNNSLSINYGRALSKKQQRFLGACIWAILWYGKLSWAVFGRFFVNISPQSFSYMLHHSLIPWNELYKAAVIYALKQFKVKKLFITVDDTQRERSKGICKIFAFFRDYNRKTGGFGIFQNLVIVCLVTDKITIPLSFAFYRPDPKIVLWKKQRKEAKKKNIPPPRKPAPNLEYPTRNELAMDLVIAAISFIKSIATESNETIKVQAVLADAAYFSKENASKLRRYSPNIPLISQIKCNQIVSDQRGKKQQVQSYFSHQIPVKKVLSLRKGLSKEIEFIAARLFVKCHGRKIYIVAIRYHGEKTYRYLACSDLTWRQEDIIKAYAFRWLQEVCFEDWKLYDGWGKAASQQGEDGACRGVFLSFIVETFLITHPMQLRLHRSGSGLYTSGSVVRQTQIDTFKWLIKEASQSPEPKVFLDSLGPFFAGLAPSRLSRKHMSGWDVDELGPAPSLQKQPKHRERAA